MIQLVILFTLTAHSGIPAKQFYHYGKSQFYGEGHEACHEHGARVAARVMARSERLRFKRAHAKIMCSEVGGTES